MTDPTTPPTPRPPIGDSPMPFPAPLAVLTVAEAASVLRVDEKTIRKLLKRGTLRGGRIGRHWRIRAIDVDALLGCASADGGPALPPRVPPVGPRQVPGPRRRRRAPAPPRKPTLLR